MPPESKKPDIEQITNRYIDAWEIFGHDRFTTEDLENELLRTEGRDPEDVPSDDKIYNDLYRLSKLGLVEWFGGKKYRVIISPEENENKWEKVFEEQMEWVRSEVEHRIEEREEEPEEEQGGLPDTPDVIEHNGNRFMSAFVGPSSEIDGQARYYQAALSKKEHDGVVLRAYQDVADSAENLAENITDDNKMSNTVCVYRFEIEDYEMDDDSDEYRIYLSETKLL
jgi:hypothetical protein